MIKELMTSRRFAPLFWSQFCSALNDNVLKNALVIMLLYSVGNRAGGRRWCNLAGAVFIVPFFVLSALGGELADRYVKSVVARRLKFFEIFAAAFAAAGFFMHSIPLLYVALALFGVRGGAVRPGEVCDAARPAFGLGARDRQRAGRGRDLHGDPGRHHRGRPVRRRREPHGLDLHRRGRSVGAVLGVRLAHPGDAALRA